MLHPELRPLLRILSSDEDEPNSFNVRRRHAMLTKTDSKMTITISDNATPQKSLVSEIAYFDLIKNWRKVMRHVKNATLEDILVRDFNKYTMGRWKEPFTKGMYPSEFES